MSSFNKAIIIGHCGQDPDIKSSATGCLGNLSIATSESWTDKRSGEKIEKTEWHRVALFNRLAEIARDYVRKGDKILIEGKLQTRKWQDKNGADHYTTEIVASSLKMLGSKKESNESLSNESNDEF